MSVNTKEIKIGNGLGDILFGISREELIEKLGDPSETEQYASDIEEDYITESWHYDEKEFSVSFDEEDNWRLTTIATSAEDSSLNNIQLIGRTKKEVLDSLEKFNIGEPELEDLSEENTNHELVSFVNSSINFWFEDDILTEIQWGVLWKNEDTPIWPTN